MTTEHITILDANGTPVTGAPSPTPWTVAIEPRTAFGEKLS